jgi:hypothetical protein
LSRGEKEQEKEKEKEKEKEAPSLLWASLNYITELIVITESSVITILIIS